MDIKDKFLSNPSNVIGHLLNKIYLHEKRLNEMQDTIDKMVIESPEFIKWCNEMEAEYEANIRKIE